MTELKRLSPRQIAFWAVTAGLCVLAGATLAAVGVINLAQQRGGYSYLLPVAVILLVFGIALVVLTVRQQRRFPETSQD